MIRAGGVSCVGVASWSFTSGCVCVVVYIVVEVMVTLGPGLCSHGSNSVVLTLLIHIGQTCSVKMLVKVLSVF